MLPEKFIHAVIVGEKYEGYHVIGVYASEVTATAAATGYVEAQVVDGDVYKQVKLGGDDVARWESPTGAYYVEVVRWPLNTTW